MSPLSLTHPHPHTATFSHDRVYRYALERRWGKGAFVLFVGLNPSTADEATDDPTIRRCMRFAKDWGYGGMLMGNVFGYRSTDPRGLPEGNMAIGPDNDVWLATMAVRSAMIVACWGANPRAAERAEDVLDALGCGRMSLARLTIERRDVMCLGRTASGAPRHPLRLAKTITPEPWSS